MSTKTHRPSSPTQPPDESDVDVLVVGAGLGGIYAVHRLREQGLTVLGIDGADGFGGVWYHNRYPGARVDVESVDYSYYFSADLYREWTWSERFATQPELLRYIEHVVDRLDLRRCFQLGTWLVGARWDASRHRYDIRTSTGLELSARHLVMATGNLSRARDLDFPGLASFAGQWVQTAHWPHEPVELAGRRVGVIGTGSSGVQVIPEIAREAGELYVFQRSPNFTIPAGNGPLDRAKWEKIAADVAGARESLLASPSGTHAVRGTRPVTDYSAGEAQELLERQWHRGGHELSMLFTDQNTDAAANEVVAQFVRSKIRQLVRDPETAQRLCPYDHAIGTRRLALDTGYYETYNRPNVTLVDLRTEPIERITQRGLRTSRAEYPLDLIVFATGFQAFTGAIDAANIRNDRGAGPTDHWQDGPRTFLGLMTEGFPNLFLLTGPGSPSVLTNLVLAIEQHVDWIAGLIAHMDRIGAASVEPTAAAVTQWSRQIAEAAAPTLRLRGRNYMTHVNADGSRISIPYPGGFGRYVRYCDEVAANGYAGLVFGR